VRAGPADRSYGVAVARLAGMPAAAVSRAEEVLKRLAAGGAGGRGAPAALVEDLPLFAAPKPEAPAQRSKADAALDAIDPDGMSPREALDALYRLKALSAE